MNEIQAKCVEAYRQTRKLHSAAEIVGIPWQTVYVHLRAVNEPVIGDKARYGNAKDKLAAKAEAEFKRLVSDAEDQNEKQFQAKVDFAVRGLSVDVKASTLRRSNLRYPGLRWAFSMKRQSLIADFVVCFAYEGDGYRVLAIPGELVRGLHTVSISETGSSKWLDYAVQPSELAPFLYSVAELKRAA